jgi:hypothetical protein
MAAAESKEDVKARLAEIVEAELADAKDFIDNDIGELRAKNTEYYNGELFGNEEPGRSQVVSRDVRDTVQAMMPSVMRVMHGGDRVVEFKPKRADAVKQAEQATDYINEVVLGQDNESFLEFHSGYKDALVRKVGIWKWYWDKRERLESTQHSGLSRDDLLAFADDETIETIETERTSAEGIMPEVFDVTVHRRITDGRARFKAVPGEQFLIDRRATSIDDAALVAHRELVSISDLVAMGYDEDELDEVGGAIDSSNEFDGNTEYNARMPLASVGGNRNERDPLLRKVLYVEAYVRAKVSPKKGDPAQLVKVCGIGASPFKVLHWEPADDGEAPFASICPDPEPHAFFGTCPADQVVDLQLIKSNVLRGTLDSLTLSLFPRTQIVDGQVNMDDLLNTELGGVIRSDTLESMREIKATFVGADSLPMLEYLDKIREDRTKQSQASQGLDADALQSSTKAAVAATISGAQANIELTCRIFAETGVKRLMRGLLKLVQRHQDRPRTVRLRGEWVEVDPKAWDAEMDVTVNVALGSGGPEEKLATLGMVKETQEGILQMLGPSNPLVSLANYRNTLAEMLKLTGYKDADRFFKQVSEEDGANPAAPPTDDPAQKLADAQKAETEAKMQVEMAKLALEREKMEREDARKLYEINLDAQVRIAIAEAQTKVDINNAAVNAEVEAMRVQHDTAARAHEAETAAKAQATTGAAE